MLFSEKNTKRPLKDKSLKRICIDSALLCLALALSYFESLLPISLIVPLPGIKLGLANIIITVAFFYISPIDAAVISCLRIILSSAFFGTSFSFLFSLVGGALAFVALLLSKTAVKLSLKISFIGISVFCASMHSVGQLLAVTSLVGKFTYVMSYLPVMLTASVVFGTVNGILLNLISKRSDILKKLFYDRRQ